jgi:radical SAM protein with 4Fe4S-binding SPASM domain
MLIILKPAYFCNEKCSYCFNIQKSKKNVYLKLPFLKELFENIKFSLKNNKTISYTILWHGGEPCILGYSYWSKVKDLISNFLHGLTNQERSRINFGIQSNLLCKDKKIYDIWVSLNFKISTSLDGPFEVSKITRNITKEKFSLLLENVKYIQQRTSVNAVSVVTKYSLSCADEIYSFFEKMKINVKFNKVIITPSSPFYISYTQYYSFLTEILELWFNNYDSKIIIEPITTDFLLLQGIHVKSCNKEKNCFSSVIEIGPSGEIYPCGRFSGLKSPIYWDSLKDLNRIYEENGKRFQTICNEFIKKCDLCEIQNVCKGGCCYELIHDYDNDFCKAYRQWIKKLESYLHS